MTNLKTKVIAVGFCAILVAGCSVLAPQPDLSRFYILTPVSDGGATPATPASTGPDSRLTIGVGPVDFPDYLRRLPVVTRVAPNRIELSDEKRWAEPLDKNFIRVLSENLVTLLNTYRIEKYPWALKTQVDYQIEVDVQRFETNSDGQTQLIASWIIRDGPTSKILYASERALRPSHRRRKPESGCRTWNGQAGAIIRSILRPRSPRGRQ